MICVLKYMLFKAQLRKYFCSLLYHYSRVLSYDYGVNF